MFSCYEHTVLFSASVTFDASRSKRVMSMLSMAFPPARAFVTAYAYVERQYAAFILRRFDKFSRGGGNWRRLRPETIKRKKSSAILVDERLLRLGLARNGIGFGARVGVASGVRLTMQFTSQDEHPKSGLTISDLATIHDQGLGVVPARRILVGPDGPARSMFARKLAEAATEELNR